MDERNWEEEWLTCQEEGFLVDFAVQPTYPRVREYSERKFRLYSCACCRRIWHLMTFGTSREVVELAERYADGLVTAASMDAAFEQLDAAMSQVPRAEGQRRADLWAAKAASYAGWSDPRGTHGNMQGARYVGGSVCMAVDLDASGPEQSSEASLQLRDDEELLQCNLLRDIFGNPFRPVAFNPSWRTSTVVALARTMYESRDFGAMPILADALQDAGCEHADVLDHCRDPKGTHVRGCWVVDLVLGKV